jgi:hypothetical protein
LIFFSTPLILRRSTKTQQSSITACRQQSPAANLASLQQLLIHRNKSSQNSKKNPKKIQEQKHYPSYSNENNSKKKKNKRRKQKEKNKTKTKQVNTKTMAKT